MVDWKAYLLVSGVIVAIIVILSFVTSSRMELNIEATEVLEESHGIVVQVAPEAKLSGLKNCSYIFTRWIVTPIGGVADGISGTYEYEELDGEMKKSGTYAMPEKVWLLPTSTEAVDIKVYYDVPCYTSSTEGVVFVGQEGLHLDLKQP